MTENIMARAHPIREFQPLGLVFCRSPLLSVNEMVTWSEGLASAGGAPMDIESTVAQDRHLLIERLREAVARPEVREAIALASPALDLRLEVWLSDPSSKDAVRVAAAVARYFSRMTCRATPFGLFAGWSMGAVGHTTALTVPSRTDSQRFARLDCGPLTRICVSLASRSEIRSAIRYWP